MADIAEAMLTYKTNMSAPIRRHNAGNIRLGAGLLQIFAKIILKKILSTANI